MISHSRNIAVAVLVLCVLLALIIVLERRPVGERMEISPEALHERMQQGDSTLLLLDVRTPDEYHSETGHLESSLLIPVQELKARLPELQSYRDRIIVAYCRTGRRSSRAADMLRAEGFSVLNLTGGIVSWSERMLPVTRTDKP